MIWNSWLIVDDSFQPVFHQPLIFQMFDVFEEFWLVWWCFFSTFWSPVKQSFLFVNDSLGVLLFIICCSFVMSWRTCAILLWCLLVTTFWSLFWNPLLFLHVSFQLLFFIKLLSFRSLEFDLFVESWLVCWCFFDMFTDYFSITDLNRVSDCRWFASTWFHPILILHIPYPCCFDLFDGSCRVCWRFFWCFPLTNIWSLVWNNLFFSSIRFNSLLHLWCFPLRLISTFSDVLANMCGFLWCFLVNTFWSLLWNQLCWLLIIRFNWIPICFPFSTFHILVVLTFGRSWRVLSVVFVMFPSHYLLVTDLKFLADCQWLVSAFFSSIFLRQHWLHFWPCFCYSFWPIRFDHPFVSFCP